MSTQMKAIVDKLLTNVSRGYVPTGMVADQVLPVLKTPQYSGKIGKYGTAHLRIVNTVMGGKGGARRIDVRTVGSDSFMIESHGLEDVLTPEDYRNYEEPFDAESDATVGLTTVLGLGKEKALADALRDVAVLTQNVTLTGSAQFSDYANSDPLGVMNTAKETIRDGCGTASDLIAVCDWKVANRLRFHPGILEALGFSQNRAGQLTNEELAKAFEVKRFLVADVVYESADDGQTSSLAPLWGKDLIVLQAPERPQKMQVSVGYQVQLTGEGSRKTYKYAINNPPESQGIIVKDEYDFVLLDAKAGYLIKNAIA